jgi:type I restriction enzyme, R subunit
MSVMLTEIEARLYRALLPDLAVEPYTIRVAFIVHLSRALRRDLPIPTNSSIADQVADLIDQSIIAGPYVIREDTGDYSYQIDLSQFDLDKIRAQMAACERNTAIARARSALTNKINEMVRRNHSRVDFQDRLQRIVDEYNAGNANADIVLAQLAMLIEEVAEEDQRYVREQLTEEELALFDILIAGDGELPDNERAQVRQVARDLLKQLKATRLVLDWRKKRQAMATVRLDIRDILNQKLPGSYSPDEREATAQAIFQHIYDQYQSASHNAYQA